MTPLKSQIKRNTEAHARFAIEQKGNRFKLAFGAVLCIAITFIMWSLSDAIEIFLYSLLYNPALCPVIANGLLYLLMLFIAAPVFVGLFFVAARMVGGENTEIIDIFNAFSSLESYGRSLRLCFNVFLRILPIIFALRAPYIIAEIEAWIVFPEWAVKYAFVFSIFAALVMVLPVSSSLGFVGFSLMYPDMSVKRAIKTARRARKKRYSLVFHLHIQLCLDFCSHF